MNNKYAFVTGATGGLGKAFAVECARRGYHLFMTDLDEEKLLALSKCLKNTYEIETIPYACNLMSLEERRNMFSLIKEKEIDLVLTINVAGVDFEGGIESISSEKIATVLRVNTEATFDITRFVSTIEHDGEFYIINVASMAGFYPMPLKALYAASKRAIYQFSIAIREEIRKVGGHLTILCPSGLRTNDEVTEKIDSQGFIGRITTLNTGIVAHNTIKKVFSNKSKYIPGFINSFSIGIFRLLPDTIIAKMVHARWKKTNSRIDSTANEHMYEKMIKL